MGQTQPQQEKGSAYKGDKKEGEWTRGIEKRQAGTMRSRVVYRGMLVVQTLSGSQTSNPRRTHTTGRQNILLHDISSFDAGRRGSLVFFLIGKW